MTETTNRTGAGAVQLWQCMAFRDAEKMMEWLRAIGFTEHATFRDDDGVVVHAEWLWPEGGGIMFGAEREDSPLHGPGVAGTYLVTADPDRVVAAAVDAGATVQQPLTDNDYGGRGGSVLDPEGNHWSFGSYQPS